MRGRLLSQTHPCSPSPPFLILYISSKSNHGQTVALHWCSLPADSLDRPEVGEVALEMMVTAVGDRAVCPHSSAQRAQGRNSSKTCFCEKQGTVCFRKEKFILSSIKCIY